MKQTKTKKAPQKKSKDKKIPYHYKPDNMTIDEWQAGLRRQFGVKQDFKVENIGYHPVFSDFHVFNPLTEKTYKVAIRSEEPSKNFCSCPDFKVNLLGTCKHIEFILDKLKNTAKNRNILKKGNIQYYSSISLKYGEERKIYLRIGENSHDKIKKLAADYFDEENYLRPEAFERFEDFILKVVKLDNEFRCYPDAVAFIIDIRTKKKRLEQIEKRFNNGNLNGELDKVIKAKLYPYQKEGVLFALKSERCLIADDMGLGKTIQALTASELFANEFNAESALIICPTSLKYQWKAEIEKFTDRSVLVIEGPFLKRKEQYRSNEFYKIASYNVVRNDIESIKSAAPEIVILDEAQRIKNWKTQTAQQVKKIPSEFALVLTGTPLENRLEELHSLVEFVDPYKLGALFRFISNHQLLDDSGKVVGYHNLNEIAESLESILIRRKKADVLAQLPERIDKNYFVSATKEQMEVHAEYAETVARLVHKWRRNRYLSEADRKRLLLSLSCMRMVCDSTYILDQKTRFDTKIDELMVLLNDIFSNDDEKVVIFSQWERMTRLVAKELDKLKVKYEYLHGGVPSKKRKDLLHNFANDEKSKVFLSTDAGGVGLNLQTANIVINLDIPWNPAVLEQRIGRVHRIGQGKHVQVINFVTKDTIEHRMLGLIGFKKSVFEGVLENGEDQVIMDKDKFKKIMAVVEDLSEPPFEEKVSDQDEAKDNDVYGDKARVEDTSEKSEASKEIKESGKDQREETKSPQRESSGEPAIQDLFITGIDFLQKLSKTFTNKNSTKEMVSSLVRKDEKTGEMSINIPIKDEKIIEKAVDVLDSFLQILKQRK
jgi:SNF2 family DNA or RNA helicase